MNESERKIREIHYYAGAFAEIGERYQTRQVGWYIRCPYCHEITSTSQPVLGLSGKHATGRCGEFKVSTKAVEMAYPESLPKYEPPRQKASLFSRLFNIFS